MLFEKLMNLVFLVGVLILALWPGLFTSYSAWMQSDHGLWLFLFSSLCFPIPVVNTVVLLTLVPRSSDRRMSLLLHMWFFVCVAILYFTEPVSAGSFRLQWLALAILGASAAITAFMAVSKV